MVSSEPGKVLGVGKLGVGSRVFDSNYILSINSYDVKQFTRGCHKNVVRNLLTNKQKAFVNFTEMCNNYYK